MQSVKKQETGKPAIGIDLGRVVIGGGDGNEDTSFFSEGYLLTPEVFNAIISIRKLSEKFDVWIISKCGPAVQQKSLEWLLSRDFYTQAQVSPEQVLFVRKRHQKAPLAEELGLIAFIDDREDIIESMKGKVPHPVQFISWEQTMGELTLRGIL
jgi:hypothetical protein